MPAAAIVTIILVVVVILVLAAFLLGTARILVQVNKRLGTVIDAVGMIATRTEPVDSVVRSINGNLATAKNVLSSLLESKVGAAGAAELVASVDPLAEDPAAMDIESTLRYERAYEEEPDAAPPWGDMPADDPSARIQYERAAPEPAFAPELPPAEQPIQYERAAAPEPSPAPEPPPPAAAPEPPGPEADRIQYERAAPEPEPPPAPEPPPPPAPDPDPQPGVGLRPAGAGGGEIRLHDEE